MATVLDDQLEQLMKSPRLPVIARHIDEVLSDEARRRQAFYAQVEEDAKAEFINGEVIMHSPVKLRHNSASGNLYRLLSSFVMLHDLGYVGHEKVLVALTRNDYEPDICFFARAKADHFTPEQVRFPAPDFVAEVLSESTETNDRGVKFEDYAAHGVGEYWIVDPEHEIVEQYRLAEGGERYELAIKAKTGQVESAAVAGFTIPVRALFDTDVNRETLRRILGD